MDGSKFKPKWTVLPIAEKACLELISCKCMTSCMVNCKISERTLFALPCANVAAHAMSSDLLEVLALTATVYYVLMFFLIIKFCVN